MSWLPESTKSALRDWLGPGFLIVALLALFFRFYDPYYEVGPPIVPGGDFERPPAESGWKATKTVQWEPGSGRDGSAGVMIDAKDRRGGTLDYVIGDPDRFQNLRLNGWIKTDSVHQGQYRWANARMILAFRDAEGKSMMEIPHAACQLVGSNDWTRCSQAFPIAAGATSAVVALQNIGSSGRAWFDDVAVTPVVRRTAARYLIWAAVALWLAGFVWCIVSVGLWRTRLGLASLAVMLGIVAGVSLPGAMLDRTAMISVEALQGALIHATPSPATSATSATVTSPAAPIPRNGHNDKPEQAKKDPETAKATVIRRSKVIESLHRSGHVAMFAALGLVFGIQVGRASGDRVTRLLGAAVGGLLFATATEVLQFPVAQRYPRWADIGRDALGLACGILAALALRHIATRRKRSC